MEGRPSGTADFVGRDDELARLASALDAARAGRGGVVLVRGDAGVGKTRLLAELAERAASENLVVLIGRTVPGGGAYRPIAEALVGYLRSHPALDVDAIGPYAAALGRLLPDWAGGEGDTAAVLSADPGVVIGEAVARLLGHVGDGAGCLLVVEDAHWADADTLALLVHLAGAVAELPVLVAVSARGDEAAGESLALLARTPGVAKIELRPLTAEAVSELALRLSGRPLDADTLAVLTERADGLPLLVEEMLAGSALSGAASFSDVPPTFAAMVSERLAGLTAAARHVLGAAAVLGAAPDWALLADVSGYPEHEVLEALRAAAGAYLLTSESSQLVWRHALTRDAVVATLLAPERAALARRAAQTLLERGRAEDETAAVELLLEAGAAAQAAELMLQLVRRNLTRGALRTAEELLDRVDGLGAQLPAVATERVRLLTLTGRPVEALAVGSSALDAATSAEHAELALLLARAAVGAGRWDDARQLVERAGRPDDPRSHALLADAAHGAGAIAVAERHAQTAVALADGGSHPAELCEALVIAAKVARLHDPDVAATGFRRAAQVAAEHGLAAWRVEAMTGLGTIELLQGALSRTLPAARKLAVEAGLVGQSVAIDMLLIESQMLAEGPAATADFARELQAQGAALRLPGAEVAGRLVLALVPAAAGQRAEVEQALGDWPFGAEAGPEAVFLPGAVRSLEALAGNDLTGALRLLDGAMAVMLEHASAAPLHQFGVWALLRTVVDDRGEQARSSLRAIPAGQRLVNQAALQYAEAVTAGRAGRLDDASALLATAEQALVELPWLRRLLRLITMTSAVADRWIDPVPLLRASLTEHAAAGEEPFARACRDLLRRAGAPTRRGRGSRAVPPALAALGVTSRELDVLALLAAGASNADIAERLFLSRRTVETHVANLLMRTGAADRAELRRRVAQGVLPLTQ